MTGASPNPSHSGFRRWFLHGGRIGRSVLSRLKRYGEMVMLGHTLFSLSFVVMGALSAGRGLPPLKTSFWILLAFAGGRNSANAINRIVDRRIDGENPRTAHRHLPSGTLSVYEAAALALLFFALLVWAAFKLNRTAVYLLPVAGLLFLAYSYTKRFTWLCHFFLGATCASAAVGGWVAVRGRIEWPALVLGAANALWVTGFDIVYSTRDAQHDRIAGLYSIPAVFGVTLARWGAIACHGAALLLLVLFGPLGGFGVLYYIGLILVAFLFFWQHRLSLRGEEDAVLFASYRVNQMVSIVLLIFSLGDMVLTMLLSGK